MGFQIVTNNPRLKDEDDVIFVEGGFKDVLIHVRDMVYSGYELISHPLFASSRMMFSPFRSILVGPKRDQISMFECECIENSILTYENNTAMRRRQPEHDDDYAYVDKMLLDAAIDEYKMLHPEMY